MEIRLYATLRENREKIIHMQCAEGMNGYDLLSALGIPEGDVSIFLVNGMHSNPDTLLKADDVIALFPPVGGG